VYCRRPAPTVLFGSFWLVRVRGHAAIGYWALGYRRISVPVLGGCGRRVRGVCLGAVQIASELASCQQRIAPLGARGRTACFASAGRRMHLWNTRAKPACLETAHIEDELWYPLHWQLRGHKRQARRVQLRPRLLPHRAHCLRRQVEA
jgi:hypothetical protein